MLDNVGLRYPHRASGAKTPRTLRPLPLLRFAVSATGGAHLCSIQYYLRFWLGICRTSLAVSALRIMRYCPKSQAHPPAARRLAALQLASTRISPQNQKPGTKNLYRTFILYYWYYMIKVSSVPSFQRRNKTTPVKPIRCAPKWRHPWRCSQPWCSRRPSCRRCAGRHPARRSRRFQWHQPQRPCQSCSAASWRRKGCRQSG